jgi:hypothetical protein
MQLQLVSKYFLTQAFNPIILNQAVRTVDNETATVSLLTTFRSDLTSYQYETFISSFILTSVSSVNKHIDLRVTPQPILAGQNVQTIELYSGPTEGNIFTKIAFTYILVDLASYNNRTSYYHSTFKQWSPFSFASNFGIPSIFNPYLSRKCIIGINWLYTKPITTNPMKFSIIDAGNTTTTNINSFQYSNVFYIQLGLFCIQECASGYSANYTNSTYYCAYNPNTAYVFCQPNYFLVNPTLHTE